MGFAATSLRLSVRNALNPLCYKATSDGYKVKLKLRFTAMVTYSFHVKFRSCSSYPGEVGLHLDPFFPKRDDKVDDQFKKILNLIEK